MTDFSWKGRPVHGILLDMDGTIVDSREAHIAAWKEFTAHYGIDIDEAEFLDQYFGLSIDQAVRRIFPDKPADEVYEIGEFKESRFRASIHEGHVYYVDGFEEFLDRIHARGVPVALVSSAPRANIKAIVEHFNLQERLPHRFSADDVEHAKPAPDLFLKGAEALGVDPKDCVVFEDSRPGLTAGHRAGCRTIAITTTHPGDELSEEADLCVPDFRTLMERDDDWRRL